MLKEYLEKGFYLVYDMSAPVQEIFSPWFISSAALVKLIWFPLTFFLFRLIKASRHNHFLVCAKQVFVNPPSVKNYLAKIAQKTSNRYKESSLWPELRLFLSMVLKCETYLIMDKNSIKYNFKTQLHLGNMERNSIHL